MQQLPKYKASFLLPVYHEEIMLAQRKTPPHRGLYSVIGGKCKRTGQERALAPYHLIEKPGGYRVLSIVDRLAMKQGDETPNETALREACEEIYSHKKYPPDFYGCDFRLKRLGSIDDFTYGFTCSIALGTLDDVPFSFSPSELEIGELTPLHSIAPEQINPLTILALEDVRMKIKYFSQHIFPGMENPERLAEQIPLFEKLPFFKSTTLIGFYLSLVERGLSVEKSLNP